MKKQIFFLTLLTTLLFQSQTGLAQKLAIGFDGFDLSKMKKLYELGDYEDGGGCKGKTTCYLNKNGQKLLLKETDCGYFDFKLYVVMKGDDVLGGLLETTNNGVNEAKRINVKNQSLSYRNSGTTTGPNSWLPGNTQNEKEKETYNEILNNFETLANRFERGQLGKNKILYVKQSIWSKNKKYYTYFDFEGNLFVFDKNKKRF